MHKFINKIIKHKPRSAFKVHDRGQDPCVFFTEFNEIQSNIYLKIAFYRENINAFNEDKRFILTQTSNYYLFGEAQELI